jgi:nitroreductase
MREMETLEIIKKRRSIREYDDQPIPMMLLERIIDAGRFAATARNEQPWEFVVITDAATLAMIAQLAPNGKFIAKAKVAVAVYCKDTHYYLEDGCAATQNILLAATDLGVGSCWIAGDKKTYIPQIDLLLKVPQGFKLVSLIALGYPKDPAQLLVIDKRDLRQMIHWEKF